MMTPVARLWEIDALRGVAVVLMIFFHLMWDLAYVGLSSVDVFARPWQIFARSIGTLFILLMGLSLWLIATRLADAKALRRYVLRRGGLIFSLGMLISLGTYLLLGTEYVRFGILHLLGAGLVLAAPFAFAPFGVTVGVSVLLILVGVWLSSLAVSFPWLIWLGRHSLIIYLLHQPLLLGTLLGVQWLS